MEIERHVDVRGFFHERVVDALRHRNVRIGERTEFYVVNLLAEFAIAPDEEILREPLALKLAGAMEAVGVERVRKLREVGDSALYVLGFFGDHLERRGINADYVVSLGGRAYATAGNLVHVTSRSHEAAFADVFGELGHKFEPLARVIDEVRESTALRTPQDIVRLYDKWRRTRSPIVAERLEKEGVFPVADDGSGETLH